MTALLALALAAEPALATKAEVIAHHRERAEGLFEPLGEPKPGEWLWTFREAGQTPSEYLRVLKNRKTDQRWAIVLVPLGIVPGEDRPLPAQARAVRDGQVHLGVQVETASSPLRHAHAPQPRPRSRRRAGAARS